MIKSGQQHIESLRDGRAVFLDGEKIIDPTTHPAYRGAIASSSVKDFDNPEINALIEKTQQSPAANAANKVKFYKLAWDAVGSEFASRHTQYEMFYAGATFVTKAHSYRTYDWRAATGLLDRMLAGYDRSGDRRGA